MKDSKIIPLMWEEWIGFFHEFVNEDAYNDYLQAEEQGASNAELDRLHDCILPVNVSVTGPQAELVMEWLEKVDRTPLEFVDDTTLAHIRIVTNNHRFYAYDITDDVTVSAEVTSFEFAEKCREIAERVATRFNDHRVVFESLIAERIVIQPPYPEGRDGHILLHRDMFKEYLLETGKRELNEDLLRFERLLLYQYHRIFQYRNLLKDVEWDMIFASILADNDFERTPLSINEEIDWNEIADIIRRSDESTFVELKSEFDASIISQKARLTKAFIGIANACALHRKRGFIIIGNLSPTKRRRFLDEATYQQIFDSLVLPRPFFVFRIHPDATKKIGVIIIHPTSTGPYTVKKHLRSGHGRRLLEKNDSFMRYGSETKKLTFVEVMELSASIATSQFQARTA